MGNKAKRGRPTQYKEEYGEQARKLCLLGATDKDLASFFEVCEATINNWKLDYPEFLESLKSGKRIADIRVAEALFNRAIGYEIKEVKEEESEANGKKTVITTKQIAGDTTAQIFWLKNRQADRWRDKQELEIDDTPIGRIEIEVVGANNND